MWRGKIAGGISFFILEFDDWEFPPVHPSLKLVRPCKLGSALLTFQSSDLYHTHFHNKALARMWCGQIASGILFFHSQL
jgi:hypothetical protein